MSPKGHERMTTYTIDTHETVRQFVAAGIPSQQAEVIVAAISRSDSDLATKADLAAAISELKADMLKAAIAIAVGIVATNVGLTVALIKLL